MLTRLRCPHFRQGDVQFHAGLNVVLGDVVATNSIGKSTLLLLIDFAFGGSDLSKISEELIRELGEHSYEMWFEFDGAVTRFRRAVHEPNSVVRLGERNEVAESWTISEYSDWLKSAYSLKGEHLSFRACVSPFSRIWKRETLELEKPLRSATRQSDADAIDNLLKILEQYDDLARQAAILDEIVERTKTVKKAERFGLRPRVTAREYRRNATDIEAGRAELAEIKSSLEAFSASIGEILNKDVLKRKRRKDELVREQFILRSRLQRVEQSLDGVRRVSHDGFSELKEFFPTVDIERLATIEAFHTGIGKILRSELMATKRQLESALDGIDKELQLINKEVAELLGNVDNPSYVVDRVVSAVSRIHSRKQANEAYEQKHALDEEAKAQETGLLQSREAAIARVAKQIDEELTLMASGTFPANRRSPTLCLEPTRYAFRVDGDTGTGTAYLSLLLLDLTLLKVSQLPYLIHDSLLFKNIEVESVGRLLQKYFEFGKQTFIAIDETGKYPSAVKAVLESSRVVSLSNELTLFNRDWRKRPPEG